MADVPRSISLTKKLSNVGELSSKHFYDGVFSAPTATMREPSTFSIRIDDYREIFTPSDASLGFSIPILDLPAVDRSDLIGCGRSSGIDYAGVFGGLGDDDRVGVPAEVLFRESKKKAKIDSHPSRSSMPTEITDSRGPEIFRDSGNRQPSKSPIQTRTATSKGQEFYSSSSRDNPTPSQVSEIRRETGTAASKGQEFSGSSGGRDNTASCQASRSPTKTEMAIPTSSRSSKTPTKTRMTHSKSLEFNGSSRDNGASSDGFKHVNVPYQEKANDISMENTHLSMDVNKEKRQGKQTRSVSDLGKVKQSIDYDDVKEFDATQSTREANGREQSVSPISNSPKLFGSNDFFRRSSSQRSKSFPKSQQSSGSTSPLLELDVSSTAAESAAAMKRVIEEAEAKIHWAKEFLKGQEFDGSTKLSFKSSLRAKAASNNTYQTGTLEDEARRKNEFVDVGEPMKQKGDLDFTTSESQLPAEQEDTSLLVCVNDARFVEKENSPEAVKSTEKSYKDDGGGGEWETAKHISQLISGVKNRFVSFMSKQADTEKIAVYDVQEAGAHMNQDDVEKDILGRFSFKQADTENAVIQEDAPTSHGSVEHQSEGSTCQDQVEKDVQVNFDASSGVGGIVQDSYVGMEIHKPGEHDIAFPDVEMLSGQHCDLSEAEGESEVQESVQGQNEEILEDCATLEHEKDRVDTDGCEENDMAQETTCQSGVCDLKKETICKDNNEIQKEVQDLEVVEKGVDVSFDCKDGTRRQEEGCSWREVEMPKDSEEKIGDVQMAEETCTNEYQEREQASKLFVREDDERSDARSILIEHVTEVADDATEHDEFEDARMVEEVCTDELQEIVQVSKLITREDNKTIEYQDVKRKSIVGVTEVTDDSSEQGEIKLENAHMVEENCTNELQETVLVAKLFAREDNKTVECQDVGKSTVGVTEITYNTFEHDKQNLENARMVEEVCTDELQETVQVEKLFIRKDDKTIEYQDVKSKSIGGVSEITDDTSEHDEMKLKDAHVVEETCTNELQETVHVAKLFTREDNKTVECQDIKGKSIVGVSEVTNDTSEHDEMKLKDAHMVEETCTNELQKTVHVAKLFTREVNKTVECQDIKGKSTVGASEVTNDTSEHDEMKLENAHTVEKACTDELQETVQVAKLFTREDNKTVEYQDTKGKSIVGVSEVNDDNSEHDEKNLKNAQLVEETCTDEIQETVWVEKLFTREDYKTVEYQDVMGKSTVGVTEVTNDTSEHDEMKLKDAHMVEETCTDELQETSQVEKLFTREDNKTVEYHDVKGKSTVGVTEVTGDTSEHDEKKLEDAQMVEETCKEAVQVEKLFTIEDNKTVEYQDVKGKSTIGASEVTNDTFEHDEMKLANAHMVEEACTDELQETVKVAKLFTREDNKTVEYQDTKGKSIVGASEVTDDTSEHDEKKLKNAQLVEETCTNEIQETARVEKLFTREDYKTVEYQDVMGKSTVGVTEVTDDTSEHDEMKLKDAHMVEETCTNELQETFQVEKLFTREDNKTVEYQDVKGKSTVGVCEVTDDTSEHDEMKLKDAHMVEETCTDELQETFQVEMLFTREDSKTVEYQDVKGKSTVGVTEVTDDTSEHDEMRLEDAQMVEETCTNKLQDTTTTMHSSMMRNKDACVCDNTDQFPEDVESTNLDHEDECPPSADESLDHKEKCLPLADETMDHEYEGQLPANVCRNEVHSCLTGENEGYKHDDRDGNSLDIEFSCEDGMIESIVTNSFQSELNTKQPNTIHTDTELIGEDIVETSVSARDLEDFVVVKEEIENKQEVYPHTSCQKIHCETDVEFEQEFASEEIFATDLNSENQGDEVIFITDLGEVDGMHDDEISYKRKRWFGNKVEADEFHQSSILLGDKIALDLDQEITQGSIVDDEVEIKGDERVKESGKCTKGRQADACNSVEGGCHITEAYHRRRRWFEDREKEVLHKTTVFDGAETTTQMDDQIAQESDLVDEGKNGTDAREDDLTSDQIESKATAEAAHRRRRWFESRENLEPIQKPIILEDIGITANQEENTVKHDDIGETLTESIMKRNQRNQLKKEKRERKAVQRAIREARERAFVDARERAAVEARQKAASQDMQGKNPSELKSGSGNKSSMDAKLREERAAVEIATSEARERAMQKAMSDKAASMSKEKDFENQTSGPSSSGYSSETFSFEKSSRVVGESPRRRRAISERHKRTMERAAKALEEKSMRDYLAQKEQAERNSLADALDVDIKSWLTGKDGNLRAMLSTLQYILGPDSGWQPIPLIDLMTSTAVRKAYKRAALCVHPDKLQQRGATIQHKYICEKVFDLLKDAWHKFNPDDW